MANAPTPLLRFHGLTVGRGDRVLRRDLEGSVEAGEILHLRGPNGVGKTSLLEVLCGLRRPESGAVHLTGGDGGHHWIGHRNALHPALTPVENLQFWCALNGAPGAPVRGALREFGLQGASDTPCRQLSAGQLRRTALARLAVVRRSLWFLDEPLSALDDAGVDRWLALLNEHQQRGGAAVITSHQPLPGQPSRLRTWDLHR